MSTKTQIDDAFNYLWNLALAIGIAIFIYLTLQLLTNSENFIQKNTILLYSFLVLMGTGVMSLTIMKLAEEEMETLKKNLALYLLRSTINLFTRLRICQITTH